MDAPQCVENANATNIIFGVHGEGDAVDFLPGGIGDQHNFMIPVFMLFLQPHPETLLYVRQTTENIAEQLQFLAEILRTVSVGTSFLWGIYHQRISPLAIRLSCPGFSWSSLRNPGGLK